MGRKIFILALLLFVPYLNYAQNNRIEMEATLLEGHRIRIGQKIIFINQTEARLDSILFYNWANAYKDRHTPLAQRLREDYDKRLHFAKIEDRGYSKVLSVKVDGLPSRFAEPPGQPDLLWLPFKKGLAPGDSLSIVVDYEIMVPQDKYTKYGRDGKNYDLRYWYICPAVHDGGWLEYSNLDMDDMFMLPTDYEIIFNLPLGYSLHANLQEEAMLNGDQVQFLLKGTNKRDIEVNIQAEKDFSSYKLDQLEVQTNLPSKNLTETLKSFVLQRQADFIEKYLGPFPHEKLLISKTTYLKDPVYGINQLPRSLNPFTDIFEWDIKMFKALSGQYIKNSLLMNPRTDKWVPDGLQYYLMMAYVEQYYPEVKALGKIAKRRFIRTYTLAKLDFNGKYPFVFEFSARKMLDQSLTTRADSLSNFNFRLSNPYKSALGLRYLDAYLKDSVVEHSIREFYNDHLNLLSDSRSFEQILRKNSTKDLDWFFKDYVGSTKKIDYTIDQLEESKDSVRIRVKNLSDIESPVAVYGLNKKEVIYQDWLDPVEDTASITLPRKGIDRLNLNYEHIYPEDNLRNNWKKLNKKLLNRPVKFTFARDIEDPYYNQVFYKPYINYNYYDGFQFGPTIFNQAIFKKKWLYSVTPVYGFKSKSLTGAASFAYETLPQQTSVYRYRAGINASRFHYDNDLAFTKVVPYLQIDFKRKSLRDIGGKALYTRYVFVDKEIPEEPEDDLESYKYNIFNIRYIYAMPDIVQDLRYFADFQYEKDFSKVSFDFRYRKLTDIDRYIDLRFYFGAFLHNRTEGDFFSFSSDRPSDYLFDLAYLGRSEDTGIFSQQVILTEGGFKSVFPDPYADEWILAGNFGIGIWKWFEFYADAGVLKSKGDKGRFKYDSGIRLNLIPEIFELYFPLQSSLGFEPGFSDYGSRIRFVLTISPERVYNYVKRGLY